MAESTFDKLWKATLGHEGGYVNDPNDSGGPTKYGITQRTLSAYNSKPASISDVQNLTEEKAKQIARTMYWDKMRASDLPAGVDVAVFDYGFHSNPTTSIKQLQSCVNVPSDGHNGDKTLAATWAISPQSTIDCVYDGRLEALKRDKNYDKYGPGWISRVNRSRGQANDVFAGRDPRIEDAPPQPRRNSVPPLPPRRPELLGLTPSEIKQRFDRLPLSDSARGMLFDQPVRGMEMQFTPQDKQPDALPVDRFDKLPPKHSFSTHPSGQEVPYTPLDNDDEENMRQPTGTPQASDDRQLALNDEASFMPIDRIGHALSILARNGRGRSIA